MLYALLGQVKTTRFTRGYYFIFFQNTLLKIKKIVYNNVEIRKYKNIVKEDVKDGR